jgi:hypothetical protein
MHALDNVIWKALTTRQAEFAESFGIARRFVPEVSPLAAFEERSPEGYESLARLVALAGPSDCFWVRRMKRKWVGLC